MPSQPYYPSRNGDQVIWLHNFSGKIGLYQATLTYTAAEIAAITADADRVAWVLEIPPKAAKSFAQTITAYVDLVENGIGEKPVPVPDYTLPQNPPEPSPVKPGALRRLFEFVANLKTRPPYTPDIGQDLQIVGPAPAPAPNAVPPASAEARSGEVVVTFKKMGHMAVWVEGQVAAETEWTFLAIDTSNPYNDTRPLKVAGQPEKRRYRLCFWDGDPTKVWTDVMEVVFGG